MIEFNAIILWPGNIRDKHKIKSYTTCNVILNLLKICFRCSISQEYHICVEVCRPKYTRIPKNEDYIVSFFENVT